MADAVQPAKGNGIKPILDTIISPKEAFESLRERPSWAIAFLILLVFMLIGYEMQRPAALHAAVGTTQHMLATSSFFSSMTDAQKQQILDKAQHPDASSAFTGPLFVLIAVLIGVFVNTLILWITGKSGSGNAKFSSYWAASICNAVASQGIASIVLGFICLLRGPDSFNLSSDILKALPSIGTIAPVGGYLGAILSSLSIFALWGLFLNMQILRWTGEVKGATVWIVPGLITALSVLLSGYFLNAAG